MCLESWCYNRYVECGRSGIAHNKILSDYQPGQVAGSPREFYYI
jgi:hypothetical protein